MSTSHTSQFLRDGKTTKKLKQKHKYKTKVVKIPKRNWAELVKEIQDKPRISGLLFAWEAQNEF